MGFNKIIKRIFIITMLACVLLSTACSKKSEKLSNPTTQAMTEPVTEPVTQEEKVERPIFGQDFLESNNTIEITDKVSKQGYVLTDVRLFSDEEVLAVNISMTEDKVHFSLYNIYTSEITKEYEIEATRDYYYECKLGTNGHIMLRGGMDNVIYTINPELTKYEKHTFAMQNEESDYEFYSVVPDNSGKYMYYFVESKNKIYRYDIATKTSTEINPVIDKVKYNYLMGITKDDKYLLASTYDYNGGQYLIINLENNQVLAYSAKHTIMEINYNNFMYYKSLGDAALRRFIDPNNPGVEHCISINENQNSYFGTALHSVSDSTMLVDYSVFDEETNSYDTIVDYYDINDSKIKYNLELETDELCYIKYIDEASDKSYVILECDTSGMAYDTTPQLKVIIWLTSKAEECIDSQDIYFDFAFLDKNGVIKPEYSADDPLRDLYERAYKMSKQYGFNIFIGDYGAKVISTYTSETVKDAETIKEALDILEDILKLYPDKMLDNMGYGYIDAVDFYFGGDITRNDLTGVENAAAYATVDNGRHIIVLDITLLYNLKSTIAHEMSHVIDKKIEAYAEYMDRDFEEEWAALNPEGFEYFERYVDEYGNAVYLGEYEYTPYTDNVYNDVSTVYFMDEYAKTFPTEDRARLFEYIISTEDYVPYYMKSPHIIAKYKLLEKWIKEAYGVEEVKFLHDYIEKIENLTEE